MSNGTTNHESIALLSMRSVGRFADGVCCGRDASDLHLAPDLPPLFANARYFSNRSRGVKSSFPSVMEQLSNELKGDLDASSIVSQPARWTAPSRARMELATDSISFRRAGKAFDLRCVAWKIAFRTLLDLGLPEGAL